MTQFLFVCLFTKTKHGISHGQKTVTFSTEPVVSFPKHLAYLSYIIIIHLRNGRTKNLSLKIPTNEEISNQEQ